MAETLIKDLIPVQRIEVKGAHDMASIQRSARTTAQALGFSPVTIEEIVLATAELASNLLRHAGQGLMTVTRLESGERVGIEIEAIDTGPGSENVERLFADGFTTRGGLGYGLGTVNRLMDEVDARSDEKTGTRIVGRKWLPTQRAPASVRWDVSTTTRARQSDMFNGDAYLAREWGGHLLVGLIDGLGHGEAAQQAAHAAQTYVWTHFEQPLENIFAGANRACQGTRGVVMALARFEPSSQMTFASVGNIEARVWCPGQTLSMPRHPGILGGNESKYPVSRSVWGPTNVLVLHTDGLSARWNWQSFHRIECGHTNQMASRLFDNLAQDHDDATVLVAKMRGL